MTRKVKTETSRQEGTLADLFNNPAELDACINVLLENDGQYTLINTNGEWIGRKGSISVLNAWLDRLEYYNKIKPIGNRRDLVPFLNNQFPGLNLGLDGRMLGNTNKIFEEYRAYFAASLLP